jgi:AbiV family abortive infection protein
MKTREEYLKIFDNGCLHIECAQILAKNGQFGFATSHLILGLEELIKYQVFKTYSYDETVFLDKETDSKSPDSIFRRHKTKHKLLKEFQEAISESFSEDFIEYLLYNTLGKTLTEKRKKIEKNRFREIGSFLGVAYREINIPDHEKSNFTKWLEDADNLKNSGFYVDAEFRTPKEITENVYETALRYTNAILEQTRVIKNLDITDEEFLNLLKGDPNRTSNDR